ncbi:hypothetical protein Tco_1316468 [Tanacetum coccineum]
MANCLTTDGIKDGLFKKKENAKNKRSSNDQNRNRRRDERNKRQRTRGNFAFTVLEQGQGQRQYAGQHPKCAKCNFHHSGNCLCVVDVTKWVTLPDTAWVELLMKDQGQLVLSVEILTTLGGIAQG